MNIQEGKIYKRIGDDEIVEVTKVILPYLNQYSELDNLLGLVEFIYLDKKTSELIGKGCSTYISFEQTFKEFI